MVMVIIILIIMNTHNGPWVLNSSSGPGVCHCLVQSTQQVDGQILLTALLADEGPGAQGEYTMW